MNKPTVVGRKVWSYLKHGPAHFVMYTAGRVGVVRKIAVRLNALRSRPDRRANTFSQDLCPHSAKEAAQRLAVDGVFTGLKLSPETLAEVLQYCTVQPCFGDGERSYRFLIAERDEAQKQYGNQFVLARYLDARNNCPTLIRLEEDPLLRGIAREYFGSEPALVGARIWWSFAADSTPDRKAESGQTFHYDIDGYRSVSFFFYLNEVDEEAGPHICVRGSHRRKRLSHLFSFHKSRSDRDIEKTYKPGDIKVICGEPGVGFAEDTFCFHKGQSPRSRDRLVLQVRFGLHDYGTGEGG